MKKFLSMVLALAMAMSLVTFAAPAAGAKEFTDNSSIQYKEAVDVISAIEIMDGYADASFNPSGTLTRGAAAKIICNMILGPTTASALPSNVAPFPDVPAGSTFAGYIAYCSAHNIISGYADGNFRPADSLSGYAFLKMLLCALGYDQEHEGYTGSNWRVNVAKQALGIGLDDKLNGELDGSRIVTREEAALYAFNTLQADMVEYDSKTSVSVNGATVSVGGSTFKAKTATTSKTENGNIDGRRSPVSGVAADIIQFAEEYFPRLVRRPAKNAGFTGNGDDDFGRPTTTWTWRGAEIGKYSSTLAKTYNGDVKVSQIYSDLGLSGTAEDAEVWMNGYHVFDVDIERSKDTELHELSVNEISNITAWNDPDNNGEFGVDTISLNQSANGSGVPVATDGSGRPTTVAAGATSAYAGMFAPTGNQIDKNGNVYDPTVLPLPTSANTATDALQYTRQRDGLAFYDAKMGNASIVEVYYDRDHNSVVINAMSVYPGQIDGVNSATNLKDAYVTVAYLNGNSAGNERTVLGATGNYGKKDNTENEYTTTTSFAEDDIVWFTFSARTNAIGKVEKMESVEGQMTRRTDDAITLDSVAYDYAKEKRFDMSGGENDLSYSSSYIVYLAFGKALWIKEAAFSAEYYALVERISAEMNNGTQLANSWLDGNGIPQYSTTNSGFDSNRVKLLLSNGTVRNLDLDSADRYLNNAIDLNNDNVVDIPAKTRINADFMAGSVVRYVENTDGSYKLYSVRSDLQGRSPYTVGTSLIENTTGYEQYKITEKHVQSNLWAYDANAQITWNTPAAIAGDQVKRVSLDTAGSPDTRITADTSTIFVVKDNDTYKVYNGLRYAPVLNDPSVAGSMGNAQAYAYTNGGDNPKAKIVFVIRGNAVSSSKDITFLIGSTRSKLYRNTDVDDYYTYLALVNGELTTLDVAASVNTNPFTTTAANRQADGAYNTMIPENGDSAWNSIILNKTTFDGNDLMTAGEFTSTSVQVGRQIGIKKTDRTDEITIGTYKDADDNQFYNTKTGDAFQVIQANDITYVIADNCNIFYCDGDGGARISYNEIPNDKDDIVYYTMNEDGELSNIFIVDFEV